METTKKTRTFMIGGKRLSELRAALVCQEADRLHVTPSQVGRVRISRDVPERVSVADQSLTLHGAAALAEDADRHGETPAEALVRVLESLYPQRSSRRARARETRRTLAGTWAVRRGAA
jgi:hypothetical protein